MTTHGGKMSAIDEAVEHAITAHYVGESSRVAAFHRALRERGYVVAPVEPIEQQRAAGRHEVGRVMDAGSFEIVAVAAYRAMLEAVR